jgi:hypothetical protein
MLVPCQLSLAVSTVMAMGRSPDSASRRLKEFMLQEKSEPTPKLGEKLLKFFEERKWPLPQSLIERNNRPPGLILALPLVVTPALETAFESFGFDPQEPSHQHKLLHYFAEAHFGKRHLGAPKKWDTRLLIEHLLALREWPLLVGYLRTEGMPNQLGGDLAIANAVKAQFPEDYKNREPEAIQKQIGKSLPMRAPASAKKRNHRKKK